MPASPLVSICIPTFNHARFLPEALASAQAQTYPEVEIVVTDNNSTDSTAALLAETMALDARVRHVRHAENLGMARNFSSCVTEARGEYVKLLCDDDRLDPECVSRLVSLMAKSPRVSIAGCARQISDEQWRPVRVLGPRRDRPALIAGDLMRRECFVWGNRIGEPSAVLIRRADALRGFSEAYSQLIDLEMWFHLLERGDFACTPEALCTIRIHDAQTTAANLRSGRAVEDKRRLFQEFAPVIGPSLSVGQRLLWDARFALTAERVRRAGGAAASGASDEAVFYPKIYGSIVNPLVRCIMSVRS